MLVPPPLMRRVPHVVPYQGSKRRLAAAILDHVRGRPVRQLFEPCAGSAAVTLAAAARATAQSHVLGDSLAPLVALWQAAIAQPDSVADAYAALWFAGIADPDATFLRAREAFNAAGGAAELLYLVSRCVKAAVRFNQAGHFNQSADRRRVGPSPDRVRKELRAASALLRGRSTVRCADLADAVADAGPDDLVYLDPPWQGTSSGSDRRYHAGLTRDRLLGVLADLDGRGVPWLLSYDGRTGDRSFGVPLPASAYGRRVELDAGRSAQATLHGRNDRTVEALYLSASLR
ncbi:MAG: DNA adenine methylase [Myxococcales bacterium]|nr:DNA adenine methylase [Myxococcales bacterium]